MSKAGLVALFLALAWPSADVAAQYPTGAQRYLGATQRTDAERLAAAGKAAEALAAYQRAIAFNDRDAEAFAGAGRMLLTLQRPQQAIAPLRRAAELEPETIARWLQLGDACRASNDRQCAQDAYIEVLRREPNRVAYEGYRAVNGDAFSHAYDFAPGEPTATDFVPSGRSGPALVLGVGSQFAGYGAHLAYYLQRRSADNASVFYAGAGVRTANGSSVLGGPVFGVMVAFGGRNRWLLDASFGTVGTSSLRLHGAWVAARRLYGVTASVGREWMWTSGFLLRALVGLSHAVNSETDDLDRAELSFSLGTGFKL